MTTPGVIGAEELELCRQTILKHSKSFSLASRFLPPALRDDAVVLYAWCRRADDAIDLVAVEQQPSALEQLRSELDSIYSGLSQSDPVLRAFSALVTSRTIPREYPEELLAGMEMDVLGAPYDSVEQLLLYCYRVAATVGLMMCHVLGISSPIARRHAAHLGMAMQLTNICRDVAEDTERARLYLPQRLLGRHGVLVPAGSLAKDWSPAQRQAVRLVTSELLELADGYYTSGEQGIRYLSASGGYAVMLARLMYSDIGRVLRQRHCEPLAPRAYVTSPRKLAHAVRALGVLRRQPRSIVPIALGEGAPAPLPNEPDPVADARLAVSFQALL